MHWALETAERLIKENPNKEVFTCASGISPSGHIHIGNFRELITTYFVVKALQKLGKKTRFIFSWDDFDRFRKVPKNIDPSYEKYIGMPYCDIPDPYGCCSSYAEHFQKEFEETVKEFGISVEYIYQHKEYRCGRYNPQIIHALNNRRAIYDIFMEYKTQSYSQEERETFYPINLYCSNCGKDNTTISSYCEESNILVYSCRCGHHENMDVKSATNIKLNWKVDWPMRWRQEHVIFEPGGTDHSSVGGSFEVSSRVVREIFDFAAPSYVGYEFIGIKGANGKMSSSSGNIITPSELLKVYTPEIVLYIFSKYHPSAGFKFGFDSELTKNYIEFERFRRSFVNQKLTPDDIMYTSMEFSQLHRNIDDYPSISKIAGLLPILNFDVDSLEEVLNRTGEDFSHEGLIELSSKIEYWIRNWCPEKSISIREEADTNMINSLSPKQSDWLNEFSNMILTTQHLNTDELMSSIYSITKTADSKETKSNQKEFFRILYNLIIGENSGPRLSLLIRAVGTDKVLSLVKK